MKVSFFSNQMEKTLKSFFNKSLIGRKFSDRGTFCVKLDMLLCSGTDADIEILLGANSNVYLRESKKFKSLMC